MNRLPRLLIAVTLVLMLAPAFGEDPRLPFDMPSQSLAQALESLTAQAKIQMFYSSETVQGKTSAGLTGSYTVPEAVGKLLQGTGLRYTFTAANAVAVKPADEESEPDSQKSGGKTRKTEEPIALPEMTVTASPLDETSYNVYSATTATKTDTPIMETPVNIQVVPQQVLRDQQAIRLDKALAHLSQLTPIIAVFLGKGSL